MIITLLILALHILNHKAFIVFHLVTPQTRAPGLPPDKPRPGLSW